MMEGASPAQANVNSLPPKRPAEVDATGQEEVFNGRLGEKVRRVRSNEDLSRAASMAVQSCEARNNQDRPLQVQVVPPRLSCEPPAVEHGPRMMMLAKGPVMRIETIYNPSSGEYRCLVFKSDRNIAIAKLIWTLDDEGEMAHVKNVFVHESVRGAGLGRLLFYQLFGALRRAGARTVTLEAEEDVRRHNRLVRFYESMGFRVSETARVLYLSNYDDYFRKVPMYIQLTPGFQCPELGETDSFMVVVLRSPQGGTICGDEGGNVGLSAGSERSGKGVGGTGGRGGSTSGSNSDYERIWVLVQDSAGGVAMLEHHVGRFLCAEPDGKVVANRPVLSTWEVFELEPYEDQTDAARELFAFKTFHGKYLRFHTPPSSPKDGSGCSTEGTENGRPLVISTSNEPTLWEVHTPGHKGPKIIEVVPDQQGRRKKPSNYPKEVTVRAIHRKMRRLNTVSFVQSMRAEYCRFQIDRGMTILQALELLRDHQDPLLPDLCDLGLSYADTLLAIAESIRAKGHPDWMQLLGILHGLGRVIFVLLQRKNCELYEDWCFGGQSWVVGCKLPPTIRYPDSNELNDDFEHPLYSTPLGMYSPHCGLDDVLLNFSGAEYMYHFLRHNGSALPREALAMVRYADLDMWYAGHQYDHLSNGVDAEMQEWVAQFAALRAAALADLSARKGSGAKYSHTLEGSATWTYYQALVDKYLPQELSW